MQFSVRTTRAADRRRSLARRSLDGVLPTAVEALDRKREALRVLRAIDALLLLRSDEDADTLSSPTSTTKNAHDHLTKAQGKDSASSGGARGGGGRSIANATESTTPGLGAYSPKTRVADKQTHFMATFGAYSGRNGRALPWKLVKRNAKTPGPGSYTVSSANNITKPRVISASFRSASTRHQEYQQEGLRDRELHPVKDLESSLTSSPVEMKSRGLVGYKLPTKPNYRTREQKQRVRLILASRKRWTHLGYYDVNYACVERQLGVTMIVPMAKQSYENKSKSKRPHPVQLRRKLRLWRSSKASLETPGKENQDAVTGPEKKSLAWKTEKEKASYKTTDQWRRAQTRQLLRVKELQARAISTTDNCGNDATSVPKKETSSLFMPAHAMSKQLGRDTVKCRQKKLKVVSSFSAETQKERTKPHVQAQSDDFSEPPKRIGGGGIVPFAKTTGRDDVQTDKHGVYILGKEIEQYPEANEPNLDQMDRLLRRRAPAALIAAPDVDEERFPMTAKVAKEQELLSVLEPKFEVVEKSAPGHRFVRFEKQLDRLDFVQVSDNQAEHELVLPSEFPILERLKFPGTNEGVVDYSKMQGRYHIEPLGHRQQTLDVVYVPNHDHKMKRAPAPVDMNKMLPRATTVFDSENDWHKDRVLCKLRENHDEIEKAMRLLSKFKRSDMGFMDMRKTTARFAPTEGGRDDSQGEACESNRPSCLELSVLSSKVRVDQTLVDMSKSMGRCVNPNDKPRDHHHNNNSESTLVLNVKDDLLSKRKRFIGLVNMKNQIPRRRDTIDDQAKFLDPTRDSATTRFLQRQIKN